MGLSSEPSFHTCKVETLLPFLLLLLLLHINIHSRSKNNAGVRGANALHKYPCVTSVSPQTQL